MNTSSFWITKNSQKTFILAMCAIITNIPKILYSVSMYYIHICSKNLHPLQNEKKIPLLFFLQKAIVEKCSVGSFLIIIIIFKARVLDKCLDFMSKWTMHPEIKKFLAIFLHIAFYLMRLHSSIKIYTTTQYCSRYLSRQGLS